MGRHYPSTAGREREGQGVLIRDPQKWVRVRGACTSGGWEVEDCLFSGVISPGDPNSV